MRTKCIWSMLFLSFTVSVTFVQVGSLLANINYFSCLIVIHFIQFISRLTNAKNLFTLPVQSKRLIEKTRIPIFLGVCGCQCHKHYIHDLHIFMSMFELNFFVFFFLFVFSTSIILYRFTSGFDHWQAITSTRH